MYGTGALSDVKRDGLATFPHGRDDDRALTGQVAPCVLHDHNQRLPWVTTHICASWPWCRVIHVAAGSERVQVRRNACW